MDDAPVDGEAQPVEDAEPEPVETAGFLIENPGMAAWPEETPHFEPWMEPSAGPAMSDWQFENGAAFKLSTAALVSLDLQPEASSTGDRTVSSDLTPQEFTGAPTDGHLLALANNKKVVNNKSIALRGAIAIDLAASAIDSAADQAWQEPLGLTPPFWWKIPSCWSYRPPPSIFQPKIPASWCCLAATTTVRMVWRRSTLKQRSIQRRPQTAIALGHRSKLSRDCTTIW